MTSLVESAVSSGPDSTTNLPNNPTDSGRGRGPRRRGRGRGGFGALNPRNDPITRRSQHLDQPRLHPPLHPEPGGSGTSVVRPTRSAEDEEGVVLPPGQSLEGRMEQAAEDHVEAEVCFICASPVVHNAVAPCNHRTCHICALRLRALYKTRACAHCRVSDTCDTS